MSPIHTGPSRCNLQTDPLQRLQRGEVRDAPASEIRPMPGSSYHKTVPFSDSARQRPPALTPAEPRSSGKGTAQCAMTIKRLVSADASPAWIRDQRLIAAAAEHAAALVCCLAGASLSDRENFDWVALCISDLVPQALSGPGPDPARYWLEGATRRDTVAL
jgi:hypothetical protein